MTTATQITIEKVTFKSGDYQLSGNLYLPQGFDASQKYPAIVFTPPFNQVKEQMGAAYGQKLAEKGYAFLAFDHTGYGDSEGKIRNYENSFVKNEDIRNAVSYLRSLPYIDRDKFYGIGACGGAANMALTAVTDKRMKAIAFISGMLNNQQSYFGSMDRETVTGLITVQNEGRQKAYETGELDYFDALGMEAQAEAIKKGEAEPNEGYDYYMTDRAGAKTNSNYSHLSPSFMLETPMLADAASYAQYLYTPFIGIIGEKAMDPANGALCTGPLTKTFYEKASEPKELVEIKGASHVSLYDVEEDVSRAVEAMDVFFKKYVK